MMRPPIHQLDLEFYFILWVPFSYRESFYSFLGNPWVNHLKGFILSFNSFHLFLPSGPLAPSFHKARYNPSKCGKPNGQTKVGEYERDNDEKL
jgi:hypothetical protein